MCLIYVSCIFDVDIVLLVDDSIKRIYPSAKPKTMLGLLGLEEESSLAIDGIFESLIIVPLSNCWFVRIKMMKKIVMQTLRFCILLYVFIYDN